MKRTRNITIIIIILAVILYCYKSCANIDNPNVDENISLDIDSTIINLRKSLVTPPISNLDIKKTYFSVNSKSDTSLNFATGSKITIPKNAFLDENGNLIDGKVKIEYREFSNAFDIYLGGIPMEFDSAGESMVFETAGMFEINATSNNKPVYVNPENKITIDMNSFEKGNQYNLYQLDTLTGKWTDIGKDDISQRKYDEELAKLPYVPPYPKRATAIAFTISDPLGLNKTSIKEYENVLFDPVNGERCSSVYNSNKKIEVKDLKNGKYEVIFTTGSVFSGGIQLSSCECYLAFKEGEDYSKALKIYKKKYSTLISKNKRIRKKIKKEWETYNKALKKYNIAVFNKNLKNLDANERLTRSLKLNSFGFVNCDYPSSYPSGARLSAKFENEKANEIKLENIVLIEKGRNALFRYSDTIKFNPEKENILWGITESGKVAYFKANDFKKIKVTDGDYIFKMAVHDEELKTHEDITSLLFN
tara:strand:+ start:1174 stop:2604 length:1431 start_codon:yes stop_codon:yes gene_type:complete